MQFEYCEVDQKWIFTTDDKFGPKYFCLVQMILDWTKNDFLVLNFNFDLYPKTYDRSKMNLIRMGMNFPFLGGKEKNSGLAQIYFWLIIGLYCALLTNLYLNFRFQIQRNHFLKFYKFCNDYFLTIWNTVFPRIVFALE